MSMIGYFYLVDELTLRRLLEHPPRIEGVVEEAMERGGDRFIDIEKAWHCLHFLLTGTAWEGTPPLDFIVRGGAEIGDIDVGYGPARGFTSAEVTAIAAALEPIAVAELAAGFDTARMEALQIYPGGRPGGWAGLDPTVVDSFGYFAEAFDAVKALVQRGRDEGRAMLCWLS